eukprot:1300475-Rhodomonas_salina.1
MSTAPRPTGTVHYYRGEPVEMYRHPFTEEPSVMIRTRRSKKKTRSSKDDHVFVTYKLLMGCRGMPIDKAVLELGVGASSIKKCCRIFGIGRWPSQNDDADQWDPIMQFAWKCVYHVL